MAILIVLGGQDRQANINSIAPLGVQDNDLLLSICSRFL